VVPVALVAGGAAAGVALLATDGPDHPDAWDPRVQDLVDFVEAERDLRFDHPVSIEFLTDDEWTAQARSGVDELSEEDRILLGQGAAMFRAIGLAEGELDLLDSIEQISAEGTVGQYSFDDQRIAVRGEEIELRSSGTLVHELTHALQDQHFDIGDELTGSEDSDEPSSLRMLVEGDADRIEQAWTEELSADDRAQYEAAVDEESEESRESLQDVPDSLLTFFAADYILGPFFVDMLLADGGNAAVDRAFADPPGPEEHALNPLSYLDEDLARPVEVPEHADGETPIEGLDGEFGATAWFLMLAERVDPVAALRAVDGWGGDAFVALDRGGVTCVRARFAGEDTDGAAVMATSLAEWAERMPAAAQVSVHHESDLIDVETCDPGAEADVLEAEGRSSAALAVPAVRVQFALSVLEGGGTVDQASCFADGVMPLVTFEQLTADELPAEDQQALQLAAAEVATRCRGAG
jgi:hypothetical protein